MALSLGSLTAKLAKSVSLVKGSLKHSGCQLTLINTNYSYVQMLPPKSGNFRRKVHYPEEYTVKPLDVTRLGGRDPETGRIVVRGIGGGLKYKFHWVDFKRVGPKEDVPPLIEKVVLIIDVFERSAKIALVATGEKMKWIIASENMKPGDLLRTSQFIPRNPVAAKEGDAYPLGALPIGTIVHGIERATGQGGYYCHAAGTSAKIVRTIGKRVVIMLPSKEEVALPRENMATVGRVSNIDHGKTPLGTAQKNRELGNRPNSGLWHRKDGRYGRRIKPPQPVKFVDLDPKVERETLKLTLHFNRQFPWEI